jgi:hypothetical protein
MPTKFVSPICLKRSVMKIGSMLFKGFLMLSVQSLKSCYKQKLFLQVLASKLFHEIIYPGKTIIVIIT